ncbi:sulfotransferase family protein [Pseudomonas sp. JM0905a]|uniref:sulfotransferase family protein n=1 Tax=Pseudomonas sp. JM0905a TaxID=2772484 RepID=UPI0016848333|nr:sulfotransferase family protein [Pseudomonas sp. JM0905a]MBD2839316.1 sulfotransferase family protein [Pseudomonas sp. JM0905a]
MASMNPDDFIGWLPIRTWQHEGAWRVDWCWFGEQRLTRPFFRDDVDQALRLPFNQAFRRETSLQSLLDWQAASPGLAPAAFIFHASRCGSTLIAQMLACLDSHVVLSEPPPLDSLLRGHYQDALVGCAQEAGVVAMLSALGQAPTPSAKHLVVKLDAWNLFELPILRRCFPDTPWVFLYRDPLEIAASHLLMPGMHMIPGQLGVSPLNETGEATVPREDYIARRLGRLLEQAAVMCREYGGLALNYSELPHAVVGRLREPLRLAPDQLDVVMAASRQNAKRPGETFAADAKRKRDSAPAALCDAVSRWAEGPYRALEALRLDQSR